MNVKLSNQNNGLQFGDWNRRTRMTVLMVLKASCDVNIGYRLGCLRLTVTWPVDALTM